MRLYDILEPIAEYVRKAKKRETLTAKGTVRAIVGGTVTICTLKLKPDREYMIVGGTDISISGADVMNCFINVKNAILVGGIPSVRTTSSGGGGCSTTIYVKTQEQGGTIELKGYGYLSGIYDYSGSIIAIEL